MLFPCFYHFLILTEHSFTGAGSINQDLVKITFKIRN